jgi:hypothetical protein
MSIISKNGKIYKFSLKKMQDLSSACQVFVMKEKKVCGTVRITHCSGFRKTQLRNLKPKAKKI